MSGKTLVVVESPAKAKTIKKILGSNYEVKASVGHVADLPQRDLGVDLERDFEPKYVVKKEKQKVVSDLKKAAQKAGRVLLATDPDREGEAISWHVARLLDLDPNQPLRVHFHEITPRVIKEAVKKPTPIDQNLVDAQQARRVLDRLVGYNLSPVLSAQFRQRALSAGRVQSVALRLVTEREAEIEAFVPKEYWTLTGRFEAGARFDAELYEIDGKRVLDKKKEAFLITSEEQARAVEAEVRQVPAWQVAAVERKEKKRHALPPFTTSTLQQAASSRLGWGAGRTMRVAQRLYEGVNLGPEGPVGLITYMRTDSVRVAPEAIAEARGFIPKAYGPEYLPSKPNHYRGKKSNVQDAHEAIRPTSVNRRPEQVKPFLSDEEFKLYDLIWRRFVASQMTSAVYDQTVITVTGGRFTFRAAGSILKFDGFLRVWGRDQTEEPPLPEVAQGASARLVELAAEQHFTQPPPRYTDASLVKKMEELGIGRPSTYAPTIDTLERRAYVERQGRALKPTELGKRVVEFLVEHFPKVVAYEFTARVEDRLDEVEEGKQPWPEVVREFYQPFTEELERVPRKTCPVCGRPLEIKVSRYGQFLGCTGYPECSYTEPLEEKKEAEPIGEDCPKCGAPLVRKWGRYGSFIACSAYPKCDYTRDEAPSTGITCPKCKEGEIVQKTSRRGKPYWRCNKQGCDFLVFDPPTEQTCPKCGWIMVKKGKREVLKCSNPDCEDYAYPNFKNRPPRGKGGGRKKTRKKSAAKKKSGPKATWADLQPFAAGLEEAERRLVVQVEGEGMPLEQAAANLGVTAEEAARLHKRAMFKLRMAYGRAKKSGA
ncbi:type I DNA topoisomerase [Oceanithermus desulfurans]|uniref:DNA topoisomerase 1 n=3 Tax=Oceanithermus TaxID=208447 RepID=A0A511RMD5_9DEIN|nr:type I DNA topoisomerase [Oceanithermus desulfurans]MBB6030980.1 DNA topoisomerase-1 [Oceanithermus desulfurans]GEM90811.1 DNA topoisomerase 1 [Oceanithermus desulfurans NBRC 100063]